MNLKRFLFLSILCLAAASGTAAEKAAVTFDVDWPSFLARHDMVWERLTDKWYECPFLGNGMLGIQIRQADKNTIRFDVGRGDVQSHGQGPTRLPIGHFELRTREAITGVTMRLSLWDAVTAGRIQTAGGTVRLRAFVHADRDVIIVEAVSDESDAFTWSWVPHETINPRTVYKKTKVKVVNPLPENKKAGGVNLCLQKLRDGGETATAWTIKGSQLRISVKHSFPNSTAVEDAVEELSKAEVLSIEELLQTHKRWWHAYYPASFISIPDAYWEGFYWIQMYKLASATRADGMLIDNQGPWLQRTPWPKAWWNLNVQLTYWPVYTANRLDLGESLVGTLDRHFNQLVLNTPEPYRHDSAGIGRSACQHLVRSVNTPGQGGEVGNLLWACHNYWWHCRYSMDEQRLKTKFYPLLQRSVNYYLHFLEKEDDGRLHIPKTLSPEYNFAKGPDCNYDLALLRWGLKTLIEVCSAGDLKEPRLAEYQRVLKELADYPQDENGMMIAKGVPFAEGHRHFSHLLMYYPLFLNNAEMQGQQEMAIKSVRHWQSLGARKGYSLTGASLIASSFGLGNESLAYLNDLKPFVQPNTLYKEAGPVIETPLSGAQAIQNMLLQSWGGVIRVFPAVPDRWPDVTIHNLRTEGAFLVSAVRQKGQTRFIRIKSLAGSPCVIKSDLPEPVCASDAKSMKPEPDGRIRLNLKKGQEVILYSAKMPIDLAIQPVLDAKVLSNFGLKK